MTYFQKSWLSGFYVPGKHPVAGLVVDCSSDLPHKRAVAGSIPVKGAKQNICVLLISSWPHLLISKITFKEDALVRLAIEFNQLLAIYSIYSVCFPKNYPLDEPSFDERIEHLNHFNLISWYTTVFMICLPILLQREFKEILNLVSKLTRVIL